MYAFCTRVPLRTRAAAGIWLYRAKPTEGLLAIGGTRTPRRCPLARCWSAPEAAAAAAQRGGQLSLSCERERLRDVTADAICA